MELGLLVTCMTLVTAQGPDGPIKGKFPITGTVIESNQYVSILNAKEDADKRKYIGDYTKVLTFNVDCVKVEE